VGELTEEAALGELRAAIDALRLDCASEARAFGER
jgi:hypothetical protein